MLRLYGYWRSSATYRVRIILALKNIDYDYTPVNLLKGEQRSAEYLAVNPNALVPSLIDGGAPLTQSLAIAEYLEEKFPDPALLPDDLNLRAQVRAVAATIACEAQPLMNLRIQNYLKEVGEFDAAAIMAWLDAWPGGAMRTGDALLSGSDGPFAFGSAPGRADALIVPQVFAARRFGVDLSDCPRMTAIADRCNELEAFQRAHPENQPDAVKA